MAERGAQAQRLAQHRGRLLLHIDRFVLAAADAGAGEPQRSKARVAAQLVGERNANLVVEAVRVERAAVRAKLECLHLERSEVARKRDSTLVGQIV